MIYKKIYLKDIDPRFHSSLATLRIYISSRNESVGPRPGLLICPGGGYYCTSPREAEPVAFRFLSEGFNCFILDYSVYKAYPAPHYDLALAFNYINSHLEEFDLIKDTLSVVGFSAGGHLVTSYGYLYEKLAKELGFEAKNLKPRAIISAYAVTFMNEYTHKTTHDIICGGDTGIESLLNVPTHISGDYPPTFIWTTKDDKTVPYINSVKLKEELDKNNVKNEFILFESGYHGSSVCNRSCYQKGDIYSEMKNNRDWTTLAADFTFEVLGI